MNESQKSLWQLLFSILSMALNGVSMWVEKKEVAADSSVKRKQ